MRDALCLFSAKIDPNKKQCAESLRTACESTVCRNDRASGRAVLLSVCLFRIRNREPGLSLEDGLHCTAESASPGGWVPGPILSPWQPLKPRPALAMPAPGIAAFCHGDAGARPITGSGALWRQHSVAWTSPL